MTKNEYIEKLLNFNKLSDIEKKEVKDLFDAMEKYNLKIDKDKKIRYKD
jgi:hypothetical protein